MPRPLRMEYAGAIYHVMNRGDRREKIFRGKSDRELFLSALAEACEKTENPSVPAIGEFLSKSCKRVVSGNG